MIIQKIIIIKLICNLQLLKIFAANLNFQNIILPSNYLYAIFTQFRTLNLKKFFYFF
jgi:hypothetical protein